MNNNLNTLKSDLVKALNAFKNNELRVLDLHARVQNIYKQVHTQAEKEQLTEFYKKECYKLFVA